MEKFNIGVIGTGYVGLVTGACLSYLGHRVTCMDKDEGRVAELREGQLPFYEPDLEELMAKGGERLRFSTELSATVREAEVVFVAVGTPQGEDGSADLSSVAAVAREIGRTLSGAPPRERPLVVVNKSTVPVGSGDYVSMLIRDGIEEAGGREEAVPFQIASNPEFLWEWSAVYYSLFPVRIVVGADSMKAM